MSSMYALALDYLCIDPFSVHVFNKLLMRSSAGGDATTGTRRVLFIINYFEYPGADMLTPAQSMRSPPCHE